MNVLLTCAGRRNYLLRYFQEAVRPRGKVFVADATLHASCCQEADEAFLVPPVASPHYIDRLLALCRQKQVRCLVPLNDFELLSLAGHRQEFLEIGTFPIISSPQVIRTCYDKTATAAFLGQHGFLVPTTYLTLETARAAVQAGELAFPCVVKPRWGSASFGIEYPANEDELQWAFQLVSAKVNRSGLIDPASDIPEATLVIQPRIQGQEYGMDVVNNLNSEFAAAFVRKKLAMRAGETDCAVTVKDELFSAIGQTLAHRLGHVGNLDCDLIMSAEGCYVLELNPRFGGGYPFSHAAGANLPATLLAWVAGSNPDPAWLDPAPSILSSKCDRLILHDLPEG